MTAECAGRNASATDRLQLNLSPTRPNRRSFSPTVEQAIKSCECYEWLEGRAPGESCRTDILYRRHRKAGDIPRPAQENGARVVRPALTFSLYRRLASTQVMSLYSNQQIAVRLRNGNYWKSNWDYTIV